MKACKCSVCGGEAKFVGFNCLPYCGDRMDPEGCFQQDMHGKKFAKREEMRNPKKKRGRKAHRNDWIPPVLREKTVHTSTVGVGK